MKTSAKTHYAAVAMLELAARHDAGEPVQARCIAADHEIPPQFLAQIMAQLKAAGVVVSTRGACGGYRLARPPAEISLKDIIEVVEGVETTLGIDRPNSPLDSVVLEAWTSIKEQESRLLASISLATLAERAEGKSHSMYYI